MITKLIGAATLFTAGAMLGGGSTTLGAAPVHAFTNEAALSQAGTCSAKESKDEGKEASKDMKGKKADGSCGKDGSCSKDKKGKKADGSCSKDKKGKKADGSCGKDGACSKDKK